MGQLIASRSRGDNFGCIDGTSHGGMFRIVVNYTCILLLGKAFELIPVASYIKLLDNPHRTLAYVIQESLVWNWLAGGVAL